MSQVQPFMDGGMLQSGSTVQPLTKVFQDSPVVLDGRNPPLLEREGYPGYPEHIPEQNWVPHMCTLSQLPNRNDNHELLPTGDTSTTNPNGYGIAPRLCEATSASIDDIKKGSGRVTDSPGGSSPVTPTPSRTQFRYQGMGTVDEKTGHVSSSVYASDSHSYPGHQSSHTTGATGDNKCKKKIPSISEVYENVLLSLHGVNRPENSTPTLSGEKDQPVAVVKTTRSLPKALAVHPEYASFCPNDEVSGSWITSEPTTVNKQPIISPHVHHSVANHSQQNLLSTAPNDPQYSTSNIKPLLSTKTTYTDMVPYDTDPENATTTHESSPYQTVPNRVPDVSGESSRVMEAHHDVDYIMNPWNPDCYVPSGYTQTSDCLDMASRLLAACQQPCPSTCNTTYNAQFVHNTAHEHGCEALYNYNSEAKGEKIISSDSVPFLTESMDTNLVHAVSSHGTFDILNENTIGMQSTSSTVYPELNHSAYISSGHRSPSASSIQGQDILSKDDFPMCLYGNYQLGFDTPPSPIREEVVCTSTPTKSSSGTRYENSDSFLSSPAILIDNYDSSLQEKVTLPSIGTFSTSPPPCADYILHPVSKDVCSGFLKTSEIYKQGGKDPEGPMQRAPSMDNCTYLSCWPSSTVSQAQSPVKNCQSLSVTRRRKCDGTKPRKRQRPRRGKKGNVYEASCQTPSLKCTSRKTKDPCTNVSACKTLTDVPLNQKTKTFTDVPLNQKTMYSDPGLGNVTRVALPKKKKCRVATTELKDIRTQQSGPIMANSESKPSVQVSTHQVWGGVPNFFSPQNYMERFPSHIPYVPSVPYSVPGPSQQGRWVYCPSVPPEKLPATSEAQPMFAPPAFPPYFGYWTYPVDSEGKPVPLGWFTSGFPPSPYRSVVPIQDPQLYYTPTEETVSENVIEQAPYNLGPPSHSIASSLHDASWLNGSNSTKSQVEHVVQTTTRIQGTGDDPCIEKSFTRQISIHTEYGTAQKCINSNNNVQCSGGNPHDESVFDKAENHFQLPCFGGEIEVPTRCFSQTDQIHEQKLTTESVLSVNESECLSMKPSPIESEDPFLLSAASEQPVCNKEQGKLETSHDNGAKAVLQSAYTIPDQDYVPMESPDIMVVTTLDDSDIRSLGIAKEVKSREPRLLSSVLELKNYAPLTPMPSRRDGYQTIPNATASTSFTSDNSRALQVVPELDEKVFQVKEMRKSLTHVPRNENIDSTFNIIKPKCIPETHGMKKWSSDDVNRLIDVVKVGDVKFRVLRIPGRKKSLLETNNVALKKAKVEKSEDRHPVNEQICPKDPGIERYNDREAGDAIAKFDSSNQLCLPDCNSNESSLKYGAEQDYIVLHNTGSLECKFVGSEATVAEVPYQTEKNSKTNESKSFGGQVNSGEKNAEDERKKQLHKVIHVNGVADQNEFVIDPMEKQSPPLLKEFANQNQTNPVFECPTQNLTQINGSVGVSNKSDNITPERMESYLTIDEPIVSRAIAEPPIRGDVEDSRHLVAQVLKEDTDGPPLTKKVLGSPSTHVDCQGKSCILQELKDDSERYLVCPTVTESLQEPCYETSMSLTSNTEEVESSCVVKVLKEDIEELVYPIVSKQPKVKTSTRGEVTSGTATEIKLDLSFYECNMDSAEDQELMTPIQRPIPTIKTESRGRYTLRTRTPTNYTNLEQIEQPEIWQDWQYDYEMVDGKLRQKRRRVNNRGVIPKFSCSYCPAVFIAYYLKMEHEASHQGEFAETKPIGEMVTSAYSNNVGPQEDASAFGRRGRKPVVYRCRECNLACRYKAELVRHRRLHSATKRHVCKVCQKIFKFKHSLAQHLKLHSEVEKAQGPYVCQTCKRQFSAKASLTHHYATHIGPSILRAGLCCCEVEGCGNCYTSPSELVEHQASMHQVVLPPTHMNDKNNNKICSELWPEVERKPKEKSSEKVAQYEVILEIKIRERRRSARETNVACEGVYFQCVACSRHGRTRREMIRHALQHDGDKRRHVCISCHMSFQEERQLKRHFHKRHDGKITSSRSHRAVYKCRKCPYTGISISEMNRHIRVHTGERPFSCNICNVSFKRRHHQIHHLTTHIGRRVTEGYVECKIKGCTRVFHTRHELLTHATAHYPASQNLSELPVPCVKTENSPMKDVGSESRKDSNFAPSLLTGDEFRHTNMTSMGPAIMYAPKQTGESTRSLRSRAGRASSSTATLSSSESTHAIRRLRNRPAGNLRSRRKQSCSRNIMSVCPQDPAPIYNPNLHLSSNTVGIHHSLKKGAVDTCGENESFDSKPLVHELPQADVFRGDGTGTFDSSPTSVTECVHRHDAGTDDTEEVMVVVETNPATPVNPHDDIKPPVGLCLAHTSPTVKSNISMDVKHPASARPERNLSCESLAKTAEISLSKLVSLRETAKYPVTEAPQTVNNDTTRLDNRQEAAPTDITLKLDCGEFKTESSLNLKTTFLPETSTNGMGSLISPPRTLRSMRVPPMPSPATTIKTESPMKREASCPIHSTNLATVSKPRVSRRLAERTFSLPNCGSPCCMLKISGTGDTVERNQLKGHSGNGSDAALCVRQPFVLIRNDAFMQSSTNGAKETESSLMKLRSCHVKIECTGTHEPKVNPSDRKSASPGKPRIGRCPYASDLTPLSKKNHAQSSTCKEYSIKSTKLSTKAHTSGIKRPSSKRPSPNNGGISYPFVFATRNPHRPFGCRECRKPFRKKSEVVAHQVVHSLSRPFKCSTCKKRFYQQESLRGHYKRQHAKKHNAKMGN